MFWKWKRAYCTLGKRTQGLRAGCDSGSSAYVKRCLPGWGEDKDTRLGG